MKIIGVATYLQKGYFAMKLEHEGRKVEKVYTNMKHRLKGGRFLISGEITGWSIVGNNVPIIKVYAMDEIKKSDFLVEAKIIG